MSEVRQRPDNPGVSPVAVVSGHLNYQRFDLASHPRFAGPAAGSSIVLPGDELPMPRKESLGRDDRCDGHQGTPAESFRFGRQSTALFVGKPEAATTELLTQHLVFLAQILDRLLLLLIHPARNRDQHEPEGIESAHKRYHVPSCKLTQLFALFSARSSFWTERGRVTQRKLPGIRPEPSPIRGCNLRTSCSEHSSANSLFTLCGCGTGGRSIRISKRRSLSFWVFPAACFGVPVTGLSNAF